MSETVADSRYPALHHMLSESDWEQRGVRRPVIRDATRILATPAPYSLTRVAWPRRAACRLAWPASGTVAWGRPINGQVGVFAAVARGNVASLVDGERYLPEAGTPNAARCEKAGIPEAMREFRTQGEMALGRVRRLRREGLHFSFYGLRWRLRAPAPAASGSGR